MAAVAKPLDAAMPVANRLLEVGKASMECMQAVLEFGMAARNQELATKAWENIRALSPIAACAGAMRLREDGMGCEEVEEPGEDYSDVKTLMYLAEWKGSEGLSEVESRFDDLKEGSLEDYGKCFKVLKRLGATEASLLRFSAKAKEHYLYFEEYVNAMGYYLVCSRTILCTRYFSCLPGTYYASRGENYSLEYRSTVCLGRVLWVFRS